MSYGPVLARKKKIDAVMNVIFGLLESEGRVYCWRERVREVLSEYTSSVDGKTHVPYKLGEVVVIGPKDSLNQLIDNAVTGPDGIEFYRNREIIGRDGEGEFIDLNLEQKDSAKIAEKSEVMR